MEGELNESEAALLEEHLKECEICRRAMEEMEEQSFVSQDRNMLKGLKKLRFLFYFKVSVISIAAVIISLLFVNIIGPEIMRNIHWKGILTIKGPYLTILCSKNILFRIFI